MNNASVVKKSILQQRGSAEFVTSLWTGFTVFMNILILSNMARIVIA